MELLELFKLSHNPLEDGLDWAKVHRVQANSLSKKQVRTQDAELKAGRQGLHWALLGKGWTAAPRNSHFSRISGFYWDVTGILLGFYQENTT